MEHLNRLIKDAANQFQCHNFQTSLSLYVRCIQRCKQENLPKYVLNNLISSEAAIRTILGEYDTALSLLNSVLTQQKQHWLCLIRRSQVYKKQNKLKKALKDLDTLAMYAPDNMQVIALKLQIKSMMPRANESSSETSEQEDQEKVDEQELLKFSNLRKIDRTSISMLIPKGRQSRVTISGDRSFFYESEMGNQGPRQSRSFTPTFNCKRFIEIDKQLEETIESQTSVPALIVKSKPDRAKSILRNRNSKLYVSDKIDEQSKEAQKKLISKIQDIDGIMIKSTNTIVSNLESSEKQVCFKKSSCNQESNPIIGKKNKSQSRKSCLKRTSFGALTEQIQKKAPRSSKFDMMSRSSIDGKLVKSDKKKKQIEQQASKENMVLNNSNNESDNESEEGSQYNIFGSKKIFINQQLRQNLGLSEDSVLEEGDKKLKKQRGQSILKKTSIIVKKDSPNKKASVFFKQKQVQNKQKGEKKAKKSVMFIG